MKEDQDLQENEINEEIKELVIIRIEASPSDLRLSVGGDKSMTKQEMIEHIRKEDNIGRQLVKVHMSFLKSVVSGEVSEALTSI